MVDFGVGSATARKHQSTLLAKSRAKEIRDDVLASECHQLVRKKAEQQEQERSLRFHGRWPHVRTFYAAVAERMPEAKRKIWLRLVASRLHDAVVGPMATVAQTESAVTTALHSLVTTPAAWKDILQALQCVLKVFHRENTSSFDYREFLCACLVLDRWQDGELRMLSLWMDEYSLPIPPVGEMAIKSVDVARILMTPCNGTADEQRMVSYVTPLFQDLFEAHEWIIVVEIKHVIETCEPLRKLLKEFCWRRLIDDMRLEYFRDIYRQAIERVETEEANCRLAAAMQLWQLREPRARLNRWKEFVYVRKLFHRGIAHHLATSRKKTVANFRKNRERKQELRRWLKAAKITHEASLVRWTFRAWQLYRVSMNKIHGAAWQSSIDHHALSLRTRVWKNCLDFVKAARSEKAKRQVLLDQFIVRRHYKVLKYSWSEWMFVYRRQKEVRVAMQLEHQLHGDIEAQRREEAEQFQMSSEDSLSRGVEERERQLVEQARRRAFQEATDRVYVNRKIKQQADERTQFKRAREERQLVEMNNVWARISERVATEVRATTIAWFLSSEGHKAVEEEATGIFERDPLLIQKALLQDPHAFALPGCRWQLRLEDYGGRFAKPFFINTETLEKFVCDELVMDNCEIIAKEVLIQRRIDEAHQRLRAKASDVDHERLRHNAAIRIQMLFLCRHALLATRNKIRMTFLKRIEPTSGDVVYFNIAKQETRRRPPRLIGSDEPLIPVESSTWVRRIHDYGNNYYLHQETGETSWTPPPHHFMCAKCKLNFATRRWNETGMRVCIVCYAEMLHQKQCPNATWTKLSVQPAKCVVCRHSAVEIVCHECRGDATCVRCCQAVHRNAKLVTHHNMDYLVYEGEMDTLGEP